MDGVLGLASALGDLANGYYKDQTTTQTITANTAADYLGTVTSDTALVTYDQQQCVTYATDATAGNTQDAIEAAKWNAQCSIDSANMNADMGKANTQVNTENNESAVQSSNLTTIYGPENFLAMILMNTSQQITEFSA